MSDTPTTDPVSGGEKEGSPAQVFPERWTVEEYFNLVSRGLLGPGDRVELLEGVIVSMSPQNPRHAAGCNRAYQTLPKAVGERAAVRGQTSLVVGGHSVPEPDVAVVPGRLSDYDSAHPTTALLVVEVAESSPTAPGSAAIVGKRCQTDP